MAVIKQVSLALNERDNEIKRLNKRIASLEAQVQQKDKLILDLQCPFSVSIYVVISSLLL